MYMDGWSPEKAKNAWGTCLTCAKSPTPTKTRWISILSSFDYHISMVYPPWVFDVDRSTLTCGSQASSANQVFRCCQICCSATACLYLVNHRIAHKEYLILTASSWPEQEWERKIYNRAEWDIKCIILLCCGQRLSERLPCCNCI